MIGLERVLRRSKEIPFFLSICFIALHSMVAQSPASMVGMLVGRGGRVLVQRGEDSPISVDGFLRVDLGDSISTNSGGGQLLLFDDSRAQLLPHSHYRVGRSALFKTLEKGCILSHQYRKHYPLKNPIKRAQESQFVGKLLSCQKSHLLRAGESWRELEDSQKLRVNDIIHVLQGGGLRLEMNRGAIVHVTGPTRVYAKSKGLELEKGKILVNSLSIEHGVDIGTPTVELKGVEALFGIAVENGTSTVRNYGSPLLLNNRCGRRRRRVQLTGLRQAVVDEQGLIEKSRALLEGELAKDIAQGILEAINGGEAPNYHERIAKATNALGRALREQQNQTVEPNGDPIEPREEGGSESWDSDVSRYFENFQRRSRASMSEVPSGSYPGQDQEAGRYDPRPRVPPRTVAREPSASARESSASVRESSASARSARRAPMTAS